MPQNLPFEQLAEIVSPDEIRLIASIGGLEKTFRWHLYLGYTLRSIKTSSHQLAALEEFRHAIESTEEPSEKESAGIGEAKLLLTLGKYREAITAASHALDYTSTIHTHNKGWLLQLIRDANLRLDNPEAAYKVAWDLWKSAPQSPSAALGIIHTSYQTGHFQDSIEVMKSFLDAKVPTYNDTTGLLQCGACMRITKRWRDRLSIVHQV